MARLGHHVPGRAAGGGHRAQLAQPRIGPAYEHDRLAIARPGGEQLERSVIAAHQSARLAAGRRLDPQLAQGLEHHLLAIGRHGGPTGHLGRETVGRDLDLWMGGVDDHPRVVDLERNDAGRAVGDVGALNLAARPEHHGPAVGRPGHVGVDAGDRPGLLHVLVQSVIDLALLARHQVLHIELGLGPFTADEGDLLAVRRRGRADRAAHARHGRGHLAGLQVIAFDLEQVCVGVLRVLEDRARRDVAGVEDALAVGGVDRLAQFLLQLLVGALDQDDAGAARDVVEPHLAGAQRTAGREVLLGHDELAVRAPAGLVEQAEVLLGHLPLVAAVQVHHPDVVATAAIRREGDALSVGRETGLLVIGQAFGDAGRRPARDRHGVDVAQQIEGDQLAVPRDIDVHPGAVVDRDGDLARGDTRRRIDVPLLGLVRLGGIGRLTRRRRRGWRGLRHGRSRHQQKGGQRRKPTIHSIPLKHAKQARMASLEPVWFRWKHLNQINRLYLQAFGAR